MLASSLQKDKLFSNHIFNWAKIFLGVRNSVLKDECNWQMPKKSQLVEKVGQRATSLVFPHHPYQANQTPNPVLSFIRELVIAYWCSSPLMWQISFSKKLILQNTIFLSYHVLDFSGVRALSLDTISHYKMYFLKTLLLHYWNWIPPGQKNWV